MASAPSATARKSSRGPWSTAVAASAATAAPAATENTPIEASRNSPSSCAAASSTSKFSERSVVARLGSAMPLWLVASSSPSSLVEGSEAPPPSSVSPSREVPAASLVAEAASRMSVSRPQRSVMYSLYAVRCAPVLLSSHAVCSASVSSTAPIVLPITSPLKARAIGNVVASPPSTYSRSASRLPKDSVLSTSASQRSTAWATSFPTRARCTALSLFIDATKSSICEHTASAAEMSSAAAAASPSSCRAAAASVAEPTPSGVESLRRMGSPAPVPGVPARKFTMYSSSSTKPLSPPLTLSLAAPCRTPPSPLAASAARALTGTTRTSSMARRSRALDVTKSTAESTSPMSASISTLLSAQMTFLPQRRM
mmetsp:Transcript_1771/g.7070  ORF Transcript_1771/g.7070 Transcript_1771/m.7070 type:complete len:370 (+) Transcript_1771:300-1409(+)